MRKLWSYEVSFGRSINDNEAESIEHCDASDYKYEIIFASGQYHEFAQNDSINIYNAVSANIYIKNIATIN